MLDNFKESINNLVKKNTTFMEDLDKSLEQDNIYSEIKGTVDKIRDQVSKFKKDITNIDEKQQILQEHKEEREKRKNSYEEMADKLESIIE